MTKENGVKVLTDMVADFVAHIGKKLPDDVVTKLEELGSQESAALPKVLYETMTKNQGLAVELNRPSCQDTGVLQFWLKCGTNFPYINELEALLKEAVVQATFAAPLRHNSVETFDEYNTNQNQMEMGDIHPLNLLEHILFTGADGMVYRTWLLNNELVQYTVQMYTENVHRYMIRDSYNSGTWNHLARWAANSDHMIEQAVKNEDANSEAIALTMRALFVSNWTDIYGDIPFSEAFQGRNNVQIGRASCRERV